MWIAAVVIVAGLTVALVSMIVTTRMKKRVSQSVEARFRRAFHDAGWEDDEIDSLLSEQRAGHYLRK